MPPQVGKHNHKLKRVRYKSGNVVFFCALDCPYKVSAALALGKRVICWRCGEPFDMNEYSLRLAKPHCENCHKPKVEKVEFKQELNPDGSIPYGLERYHGEEGLSLQQRLQQTLKQAQSTNEVDEEI